MYGVITLSNPGTTVVGPFNIWSDVDGYLSAFETSVSLSDLLAGYFSSNIPDGTLTIRVKSLTDTVCAGFTVDANTFTTTTTTTTLSPAFTLEVKPDNAGTSNPNQFTIPTNGAYTYDYDVEVVGDTTYLNNTGDLTITFTDSANKIIKITGDFPTISFNSGGDRLKMLDVLNWGTGEFESFEDSFYGCANMQISATDGPIFAVGASMYYAFRNCTALAPSINHWNVTNVTTLVGAFDQCSNFNSPLNSWNVSNVTSMYWTFRGCTVFNQDLDNWNTSGLTGDVLVSTFEGCSAFNQNISTWDVSGVTSFFGMFRYCSNFNQSINGWPLTGNLASMFRDAVIYNQPMNLCTIGQSGLEGMNSMFYNCAVFNQDLDTWNTSTVGTMASMFYGCTAFNGNVTTWNHSGGGSRSGMFILCPNFDQDLSGWNISIVTSMSNFMTGTTLSTANYDAILISWSTQIPLVSSSVSFGNSQYTLGGAAEAARTTLLTEWSITDGGGI